MPLQIFDIINPEFCAPTSQIHKVDHTETHQTIQSAVNVMCFYILLSRLEVVVRIICTRQSSSFGSFCASSSLLNNSKIFTEAFSFFVFSQVFQKLLLVIIPLRQLEVRDVQEKIEIPDQEAIQHTLNPQALKKCNTVYLEFKTKLIQSFIQLISTFFMLGQNVIQLHLGVL